LRFRDNTVDGDGIWARYSGGKFAGSGFDSGYNMYQLGYDKADNAKSTYGFAIDSGNANARYGTGSGKDKLFAGSIYGTWHGDNSSYTDVVTRFGQFDTDIRSYGDYPDKAKAKSLTFSILVKYHSFLLPVLPSALVTSAPFSIVGVTSHIPPALRCFPVKVAFSLVSVDKQ